MKPKGLIPQTDYKELVPHFSESEIKDARSSLYKYDERACSNNRKFDKGIKAIYSNDNYTDMSLKRTYLNECKIRKGIFTRAAVTGSMFIKTIFEDCRILGTSFQCCDFIESELRDFSSEIEASNFSNSVFTNTKFENVKFRTNTIYQSLFEKCTFTDCVIETTTLEGSIFRDCAFNSVDLSNLNIDYVMLHNPTMHDVILPFFQVPYIINGFFYLNKTNDDIWIYSDKSLYKKIKREEYLRHTEELIIYYYDLKEFFPLANIYLAENNPKKAFACIMEGIERASKQNDFRMIKHFCRLLTSTSQFTGKDIKTACHTLEAIFDPRCLTNTRNLHAYLLNIGDIRDILLRGNYGLQKLEVIIQTNIDSSDAERFSVFSKKLNKLLDVFSEKGQMQFIESRHSSDWVVFINCVNPLEQLKMVLASIYYAFGAIAKATQIYNKLDGEIKQETLTNLQLENKLKRKTLEGIELDNEIKRETLENVRNHNSSLQENNVIIKLPKKQIEELAEEKSCVLEITHYIKGVTATNMETHLLYSKTIFEI